MATAERLVAEGKPRPEFIAEFREAHPTCNVRTVDRYKANAFRAIRERREAERGHDIDVRLHRLTYLSHKLEREGAYSPMMRAEQLLAQITGVLEAEKHLHLHQAPQAQGQMQAGLTVSYRDLPDAQLDALEAALRSAAVQAPPEPQTLLLGPGVANDEGS
jgi:hypothetical protein